VTLLITSIYNQLDYPGGNKPGEPSYDCWVMSAIQCRAAVAGPPLPTITTFRAFAGDPLDGDSDKGSLTELVKGITGCWPDQKITVYRAAPWAEFSADLKVAPLPASISVNSANLPWAHRFGYYGLHQITVFWQADTWWDANPLAPQGSLPLPIGETQLRTAINGYSNVGVYGVLFHEVDMPGITWNPDNPRWGTASVNGDGHAAFDLATREYRPVTAGYVRNVIGTGVAAADAPPAVAGKRFLVVEIDGRAYGLLEADTDWPAGRFTFYNADDVKARVRDAVNAAADHIEGASAEVLTAINEVRIA